MKRHKTAAILALALVAVLLATACQEAQKTADLRVTLDDSIDRTLVPKDPEEFKVVKYRITCQARGGGDPITLDTIRSSIVFQGLPLGTYDISATGRNESGQDIVSGSSEFNLTGSNTSATIVLNRLIGSGHISITFTWDMDLVGKPSVHVTLTPMDGQEGNTIEKTLEVSGSSATFTANDLPSGSYRLTAKLMDKGVSVAGCVEAVRIADKSTVSAEIPFNLDKLPSSPGNITLENQAGIPIACTIEGVEEGQTVQAQQELEVDLVTDGLEEMSVQVEWYLDGSPVGSGRSITLTPQPGQHRLDVVASTDKLGSSGSTTIKFEAALLGDIGVPVMGGRVTEAGVDGLSLSGDMVMDFLVDGNLMIVDNDANRIQTCAIVRNTLRLDGSQEIEDDIVVAASIAGTSRIGFATLDNRIAMYEYSSGTGRFSEIAETQCISDDGKVFFDDIYGISRKAPGDNMFAVFGFLRIEGYDSFTNAVSQHDWEDLENFKASFQQIDSKVKDSYDVFGVHHSGDDAIMIDLQTRRAFAYFQHLDRDDRFDSIYGELPQIGNPTAVTVLPSSGRNILRMVVADDDRFLIYEGDKDGKSSDGFTYRESMIRPEGSGLESVRFILNATDTFLYVLNQGNDSISTYSVSSEGRLTYKAMTELGFSPVDAVLSPDGGYMAVYGTGGEFAILRIRTGISGQS